MKQACVAFLAIAVAGIINIFSPAHAAPVAIYDSISSLNGITRTPFGRPLETSIISDPNNEFGRSFTGNPFNSASPNGALITGMDFYLSATTTALTTYQSIRINTQFWNDFGGSLGDVWFANPSTLKSNVISTLGALPPNITFIDNGTGFSLYLVSLTFDSPVAITNANLNGVTLNIQGNTGSGFFNTDNLSTYRTRGNGFVIGSSPASDGEPTRGGYLRNASGRVDYNFTDNTPVDVDPSDLVHPGAAGAYEALGMRIFVEGPVVVPETNTFTLLALGAVVPLVVLVRRRKR